MFSAADQLKVLIKKAVSNLGAANIHPNNRLLHSLTLPNGIVAPHKTLGFCPKVFGEALYPL
jgi:hypothetical protein